MPPKPLFDETQRFACRDCPARCCRLPCTIPLAPEERERLLADEWVRERVGERGVHWIERGVIPTRDRGRLLECVFLDDDERCALQKRHGHGFLARTCQSFPFGFVRSEQDRVVTQLSQLCPSIRDNRGEPLTAATVASKLEQKGEIERMSKAMATRARAILSQHQYLRVVARWQARLADDVAPVSTLVRLYDESVAFELGLPAGVEKPSDEACDESLAAAGAIRDEPFMLSLGSSYQARALFAYLLGGLCYPSRVALAHRVDPPPWYRFQGLRTVVTKLKWWTERGRVDLLYLPRPVDLGRIRSVERFLPGAHGAIVRRFLLRVLERRQIFSAPRYLMAVLVDLALATVLVSRYARCRAASEERSRVTEADVLEGTAVAELVLLAHASLRGPGKVVSNLRPLLLANRETFLRLLASEN